MVTASHQSDPQRLHWLTPVELKRVMEAAREGLALLLWKDDVKVLHLRQLRPDTEYFIGRSDDMSVPLSWDGRVSGLHAKLVCAGGEWLVTDDGWSKNGTFVNEERVDRSARLREKDVIRIGRTQLGFRAAVGVRDLPFTTTDTRTRTLPKFDEADRAILVELCRIYFTAEPPGQLVSATNKDIALALHLAEVTVSHRLRRMYARADINHGKNANRTALMQLVIGNSVITARQYERR